MSVKVLFTAHATATGGRNGHTQADDGLTSVDLSIPKAMGGPGKPGTSTPEHLFAAGYAACFGSACEFAARQLRLPTRAVVVRAAVGIGESSAGGYGLTVTLEADVQGALVGSVQRTADAGADAVTAAFVVE